MIDNTLLLPLNHKTVNNKTSNDKAELNVRAALIQLREQITEVDEQLLQLLANRRRLSLSVAKVKGLEQLQIRDHKREEELLERLIEQGKSLNLDAFFVTRLFHKIIDDSVRIQQQFVLAQNKTDNSTNTIRRLAILGGKGSYSYFAAKQHYAYSDKNNAYIGCPTFAEVLHAVEDGQAEHAVIPIENTTSGGITEVYDLLLHTSLSIIGEEKYQIEHCLIAKEQTSINEVKTIYAHPQALRQCDQFLNQLKQVELKLVESTADAVQQVLADDSNTSAAIGGEDAAELYQLEILQRKIANQAINFTRFLIVSRKARKVSKQLPSKTSLVISTGQKAGSLADALYLFKQAEIPLTKLESRPVAGNAWEQMFYLDIEGNISEETVNSVLDSLNEICPFMKVLGCYPSDDLPETEVAVNEKILK